MKRTLVPKQPSSSGSTAPVERFDSASTVAAAIATPGSTVTVAERDDADLSGTISPLATRRLLPSIGIVALIFSATYAATGTVLLPNQIANIDPTNKVADLAIVTSVSFIFSLFTQPIVGAFSDRTRSRLGRRAPWMVIGVAVAAIFMVGIGSLQSILWITVFWVIIQVALNAIQGPLSAITPDRFPRGRRGIVSAIIGLGSGIGVAFGIILAGRLANNVGVGYSTFGIALLVLTLLFVFFNRDFSSKSLTRPPFSWKQFFAGFWISPRKHRDFGWAFAARFFFVLAYFIIYAYQLFILTDYIKLSLKSANVEIGVLSIASLLTTIVAAVLAGWLSDKLGRRKVFIYTASALLIVGMLMPLLMPTVTGMIAMSALNGAAFGLYLSCDTALMTEVLPGGGTRAAKDLGILNVATNIPQTASGAIAAVIITYFGGYPAMFVFAMICAVVAALVIIPIKSVR
jgi:MFS family permease